MKGDDEEVQAPPLPWQIRFHQPPWMQNQFQFQDQLRAVWQHSIMKVLFLTILQLDSRKRKTNLFIAFVGRTADCCFDPFVLDLFYLFFCKRYSSLKHYTI